MSGGEIVYGNIHNYPYMYGIGDGTSTFVLPDYRGRFIQGGDSVQALSAGLPNIYGQIGEFGTSLATIANGAFTLTKRSQTYALGYAENLYRDNSVTTMYLNANLTSNVYGAASTVQPPAFMLLPQIRY